MDNRTEPFLRKFKNAQELLKAKSVQNIVSLKYRENCVNNSEYAHFIDEYLRNDVGLDVNPAGSDFWGNAWVISNSAKNKIILVEHETGLEILYVAGSIASLVALIPVINSGWKWFRNMRGRGSFSRPDREAVELRRISTKNTIIEQQIQNIEVFLLSAGLEENIALHNKVKLLEKEIAVLKKSLQPKIKTKSAVQKKTKK
jgi:hypothetical protein